VASRQESYVQNRNPSQNDPSQASFLDRVFARARARIGVGRTPPEPEPDSTEEEAGDDDERTVEELLDGADLLREIREPIEWILALAHELAGADPVDVAAVARLRAAFHARLAGLPVRIRKSDLLVVAGLLIAAFDPSVVLRAVSETISEGLAAVLGSETPVAFQIRGPIDPLAALTELFAAFRPRRFGGQRWQCPVHVHFVR
jgi:hypothetical protein